MKKWDYENKVDILFSDHEKFTSAIKKQTEKVKTKMTVTANKYMNKSVMVYKNLKRVEAYTSGYLYLLLKIHKCITDPPLRPRNLMSGTVTHDVAQ